MRQSERSAGQARCSRVGVGILGARPSRICAGDPRRRGGSRAAWIAPAPTRHARSDRRAARGQFRSRIARHDVQQRQQEAGRGALVFRLHDHVVRRQRPQCCLPTSAGDTGRPHRQHATAGSHGLARAPVPSSSSEAPPRSEQNCLGTLSPSAVVVRLARRVPSPAAIINDQTLPSLITLAPLRFKPSGSTNLIKFASASSQSSKGIAARETARRGVTDGLRRRSDRSSAVSVEGGCAMKSFELPALPHLADARSPRDLRS